MTMPTLWQVFADNKGPYDTIDVLRFNFRTATLWKTTKNMPIFYKQRFCFWKSWHKAECDFTFCDRYLWQMALILYAQTDIEKAKFKSADGEKKLHIWPQTKHMKTNKATAAMKYFADTLLKMMVIMLNEGVSLDDYATGFYWALNTQTLFDSVDVTKTAKAKFPEFSVSGDKSAENITQIVEKWNQFIIHGWPFKIQESEPFRWYCVQRNVATSLSFSINAGGIGGTQSNGDKAELEKEQRTFKNRCDGRI